MMNTLPLVDLTRATKSPPLPVVIIGGGLAGLTAAYMLSRAGIAVQLLEADPERFGGRLKGAPPVTFAQHGQSWTFPAEHGIHGVWGQYHNLRAMLRTAQIDPEYVPAREEAWIMRRPRRGVQWARGGSALRRSWIPAPLHYLALFIRPRFLQMLTLRDLASMFRVLGGLIFATAYDPAAEVTRIEQLRHLTLAEFFKGWSPTMQSLFVGLARNFTSARPEDVPQAGFIAFLRFYTLMRRDSWQFSYFKRDSATALIDPLVERLHEAGVSLHLGATVTALARDGERWQVTWRPSLPNSTALNADTTTITAEQVILALDAPATRKLLTRSLNAQHVQYPLAVPSAILRFWFEVAPRDRSAAPEAGIFTGEFVLDNYFWLHRFQEPFQTWHTETGGAAIECHIYGPPALLLEPDAVLLARGLGDLQRVWPILRGKVLAQSLQRNAATHSLFGGNSPRGLAVETGWTGLWACGDWVNYAHPSLYMERATVTAIATANGVLAAHEKPPVPILPVDPPEFLARGLEAALRWLRRTTRRVRSR